MNAEELLERYASGERDFAEVDLSNANLHKSKLIDINLANANLTDAYLSGYISCQSYLQKSEKGYTLT